MTDRISRPLLLVVLSLLVAGCREATPVGGQRGAMDAAATSDESALVDAIVDVACGQCQFGLPGKGCDLAIRIEGRALFVDGTGIDDHGDAHAADGLCNAVRRARVSGRVVDGRFRATSLELLPAGS